MAHALVSTSIAARDARGVVYVGLAFLAHMLIWASVPAAFAVATSMALILIERLVGEVADTIIAAVAAGRADAELARANKPRFRDELKIEILGPAAAIGLAFIAAVAGLALKPWMTPVLAWLGS